MTKRRVLIGIGAAAAVVVGFALLRDGRPRRASHSPGEPAGVAMEGPRLYPPSPAEFQDNERPAVPAATPASTATILSRDSNDYAREIAQKPEFRSFASSANLTPDEQAQVSHIVALYYMDDASLRNSTTDAEKLSSMRRQLLIHMHVRVRSKIPSKWEAFERANLLPSVADFANSPT